MSTGAQKFRGAGLKQVVQCPFFRGAVPIFSGGCFLFSLRIMDQIQDQASSSNSNVRWSEEATEALIALFSDGSIQLSLEASKTSKETSKIYKTFCAS